MINRRGQSRGLVLYELMLTLSLLTTFALIAGRVLRSSMQISRETGQAASVSLRLEGAVGQLRRDVWSAASITSPDPQTAKIDQAGQATITWNVTPEGSLVRTIKNTSERLEWSGLAGGFTFEADGPVLLLIEPPNNQHDTRRLPLVSQIALAKRGGP